MYRCMSGKKFSALVQMKIQETLDSFLIWIVYNYYWESWDLETVNFKTKIM